MTTHGPYGFATATTDGSDDFLYTASNGNQTGATLPATSQNLRWRWLDGETASTGVGPQSGEEGAPEGYIYIETSDTGSGFNDTYDMEFDTTLDAAAEQWQFNFYTNQRGNDNDVLCQVQINEDGGGWVNVGSAFGGPGESLPPKVATSGTDIWESRSVDLSNGGANNDASTRVRILLTMPASGTSWHNDFGIDTIEIVGTVLASYEQDGFRFEDDDGTESGSTFLENQNVDLTIAKETAFRVRQGGQLTGDPDAHAATEQYKETGDGASEWRDIE